MNDLERATQAALASIMAPPIKLKSRSALSNNKEMHAQVVIVEDGILEQFVITNKGRHVVALHYAGESLVHWYPGYGLSAAVPTTFRIALPDALCELVGRSPAAANSLRRAAEHQQTIAMRWLHLATRSSEERLAHFLCEQAYRSGAVARGSLASHSFKQRELADALSLTSVHINRLIKEFEESELIIRRGRQLEIKQWTELARLGSFNNDYLN